MPNIFESGRMIIFFLSSSFCVGNIPLNEWQLIIQSNFTVLTTMW